MSPPRDRLLLASIHDVSPRFESEIDRLIDLLRVHVRGRLAMLVVPNHWGDAPILPGSPFATRLRNWAADGMEMFLHGYNHRDDGGHASSGDRLRASFMTAGEGEFLGLSKTQATDRLMKGRELVEGVIGQSIAGFIAPAWLYGSGALEALRDARVPLAEDHLRVWSPVSGQQLARGPVITWASRTPMRLLSSLGAAAALRNAPIEVLRIGVHPPDVHHNALVKSIDKTFRSAAARRRAARYSDLLPSAI
ncbi:MAG: DUF2334 domain-containing protein [Pseudomonadota bacterium]|nr:DUF2334 domain-containing protein [Pseudomonadota bacterium]